MDLLNKINRFKYQKSNVNLISSILKYYGSNSNYNSLELLDKALNKQYKNVCLLVFDGLGDSILNLHSEFGIFNESKVDVIDAVFPPTTVAAIDTFESGLAPIEHGWLGWRMYFKDYDKILDVFTGHDSYSGELITKNHQNVIKYEKIFSKIKRSTFNEVECHEIYPSMINRNPVDYKLHQASDITSFFDQLSDIVNSNNKEKFIYGYWTEPDYSMHGLGTKSIIIKNIISKIEEEFEKCAEVCDDTLFIITADHGLIDIDEIIYLNDFPDLLECLVRYPDIDSRCMNFVVKEGFESTFKMKFNEYFSNHHLLIEVDKALEAGMFGRFKMHNNCKEVFGTYLGIATSKVMLSIRADKAPFEFKASHAGLTEEEINVPLIIYENRSNEY